MRVRGEWESKRDERTVRYMEGCSREVGWLSCLLAPCENKVKKVACLVDGKRMCKVKIKERP